MAKVAETRDKPVSFRQDIRIARMAGAPNIAYAVSGRGYPLVRAATWTSNLEFDWRTRVLGPLYRELSADFTLYRYNPRGYGLSEGGDGEVTLDTLVQDLEAVVHDAGLKRLALWGATTAGSVTAIAFAARHPECVSHLVLSAPVVRGSLRRAGDSREEADRFQAFVKLVELGWGEGTPAFRQVQTTQMFPQATPAQAEELNELFRVSAPPRQAARMVRATGEADVADLLPRIACPALLLHCGRTPLMPIEEARLIASRVAHARLVALDSRNYMPMEGEPAFREMLDEIRAFLPRLPSAQAAQLSALTPRELQVLDQLARGLDNRQIAARLGVSEKTVRNTVSHVFDKLGVPTRAQAIVLARRAGLGE